MKLFVQCFLLSFAISITTFQQLNSQTIQPADNRTWEEMMADPNTSFFATQQKFNEYWAGRPIGKGKGYKAFKRWEYFMAPRVNPVTGDFPDPDAVWEAQQEQPGMFMENENMPGDWTYIGNTNVPTNGGAGRINSVRALPGSTTTLFACSPGGGLWKTTNSGTSWSVLGTDFLSSIGTSDVAIDPTNTSVMYLATGDGDAGDTYALGVLKSTDGGATWNTTGLNWTVTQTRSCSRLIIHPTNTQIVICATSNGIWRTTDGGTNWTQEQTGNFKDITFKPGDASTVYATSNQFYKSTDTGNNWTNITAGLPISGDSQRMSLAVTAANSAYVYILASAGNSGTLGIYRSTDSGANFTEQHDSSPNLGGWSTDGSDGGGQGWYDLRIAADPSNANTIYTGGVNVWKSTNGGTSFALNGHWYGGGGVPYVHADIHALYFVPGTSNLLVGCDGGVFSTSNGGTNWADLSSNLAIAQQYKLGLAALNSNLVITGWQDNGTGLKNGASHSQVIGGDGMECAIDHTNSNIMYGELYYGSIYKSTNGGAGFSNIVGSGGSGVNADGGWVTPFVLGTNGSHLYVGKSTVYKSTDGGGSFTASAAFGSGNCSDLAVFPGNNNIVYASKGGSLYKTTDNNNYSLLSGLPGDYISDIALHNTDPNKVWVTFSNYSSGLKVYYSSNGGSSWTNISGTLPNIPANAIVYANGTNDGIYVGMDAGIFYRDNVLGSWVPYMNSLPNVEITELEIHYATSTITASTYGRGIWRAPMYAIPNLDAVLTTVTSPTGSYCTSIVSPQFEVLNAGTNTITSMSINYQVSGQALQNYVWNGSLATSATTTITLPNINYGAGSFTLDIDIISVNSITDDNTGNNSGTTSYVTIDAINTAVLHLTTDCYPTETSWQITDDLGIVLASGSGYGGNTTYNIPVCLPDGCFTFTIMDTYGDGIYGWGNCTDGDYEITDDETGDVLVTMDVPNFGFEASHEFCYSSPVVLGCTTPTACNYNPLATQNDGSCTFSVTWYLNADGDSYYASTQSSCTSPGAGWTSTLPSGGSGDCNDSNSAIHPGATENLCNNIDDNCNGTTDEGRVNGCTNPIACNYNPAATCDNGSCTLAITWYLNADGDTYYASTQSACSSPGAGWTSTLPSGGAGDCNDSNSAIHPGATENLCNNIDDNCNGTTDEGRVNGCTNPVACNYNPAATCDNGSCTLAITWYLNADGDTYYASTQSACTSPGAGWTSTLPSGGAGDCNDSNSAIHPGATENLCNNIDDNCNGTTDEGRVNGCTNPVACNYNPAATCDNGSCTLAITWYLNADGDTYYASTQSACSSPGAGWTSTLPSGGAGDCNDSNSAVYPGATEICNGIDDNCNAQTDEGFDQDNDGFTTCEGDCSDTNPNIFPGAPEACNGTDDDCDTVIDDNVTTQNYYNDTDGDGFGSGLIGNFCSPPPNSSLNNSDCNDANEDIHPNAIEVCNGADDNCNGSTDEGVNPATWYPDNDGDTYGQLGGTPVVSCSPPAGYVLNSTDCNDANAAVHPGAVELCNGADDNCNGSTDEGVTLTYYADADGDGYGNAAVNVQACSAPAGYVLNATDCNDSNTAIHPGGAEVCGNAIDENCNGLVNEGCGGGGGNNDSMAGATVIQYSGNAYPSCNLYNGTLSGATVSSEGNPANVITGEDRWFTFFAASPAVRVVLSNAAFNGVLELHNAGGAQLDAENMTSMGSPEIMNFDGLTEGNQYFVAVRNYNSALGTGTFTLCIQHLMDSNCDYGPGTYAMCTNFKADYSGANLYIFHFTPIGGGPTTTGTGTSQISLGTVSLGLQYGGTYINTVDALYNLVDGAGNPETFIVEGNEDCTITIAAQPDVSVKPTQRCPATILRSTWLQGKPFVCGAIQFEFEFTETDQFGTPIGLTFTKLSSGASSTLQLNFTSPQSLTAGSFYSVRMRPLLTYGPGTYGNAQCIKIGGTSQLEYDPETAEQMLAGENEIDLAVYPNPTNGQQIHLNLVNAESDRADIRIIDSQGRLIYSSTEMLSGSLNTTINFDRPLANGIYAIEVKMGNKVLVERLQVQK